MANYEAIFNDILKKEGGYQKQPSDVGNWCGGNLVGTNYGIAATGYKQYYGVCPSALDIKNLTKDDAKKIWKKIVWDKIRGDEITSQGVAAMILDAAGGGKSGYLHTRQAINDVAGKNLVNENSTMLFTNNEIVALNSLNQLAFFKRFNEIRKNYFINHPQFNVYGKGWLNRLKQTFDKYINELNKYAPAVAGVGIGAVFFLIIGYFLISKFKNK